MVPDCDASGCEDLTEAQEELLWEVLERTQAYAQRLERYAIRAWRLCGDEEPAP